MKENKLFCGLKYFPEARKLLKQDALNLLDIAFCDDGHLADIVGSLRTVCATIEVKAKRLHQIWNASKQSGSEPLVDRKRKGDLK